VKMRVGVMDGSPAASAARVRAAREALGPDIKLMADAHGTWSVAEAKAFCRMVEDLDLYWFEEPVTADDKPGLAEVRRSGSVPISTGESEFTRHDFREIAELRAADVLQPDLAIAGGLTEGVRIGAIASAFNLRLAPHLWSGAPAFAAGLHLAASSSAGFILEYSLGHNPMLHDLVDESFPVVDGQVEIPDRPGLGITVRESFLQQYGRTA
jgi:L-alanine-DL-glutamate epimerase-like enolase superfamily enzyme